MIFRPMIISDIPQIMVIRFSVKENQLSDPSKVTAEDCRIMLEETGRGWVCEIDGRVVGFSIVDSSRRNVWALFIFPENEGKGIGRKLLGLLVDWSRSNGLQNLWLSTDPSTRAEGFYKKMGWTKTGVTVEGEARFELEL